MAICKIYSFRFPIIGNLRQLLEYVHRSIRKTAHCKETEETHVKLLDATRWRTNWRIYMYVV